MSNPAACLDHHQSHEDAPRSDEKGLGDTEGAGGGGKASQALSAATFRVEGMDPAPQGSKRWVGGRRMIESCARVKPWRLLVADAAITAGVPMMRGPVQMSVVFIFARPAGHFRKDGTLKPSAPRWHCVRPDGSKLLRSTEDALSKLVYEDDSRIVGCNWSKRYVVGNERPGAIVTVIQVS